MCICADLATVDNRVFILILQHPQERREVLGSGQLARLQLRRAQLEIGLSWPGLGQILGRNAEPARWASLFLGTAKDFPTRSDRPLVLLDRAGKPLSQQDDALASLEGLVLLDGTWAQAKTLWWRNPWLLKTRRLVLRPSAPSLYGRLRREPRREALSTLEAAAFALGVLENRPDLMTVLTVPLVRLLDRYAGADGKATPSRETTPAES